MDKEELKNLVLEEFKKRVPAEIATDEKRVQEFVSENIDEPLLDKLVEEFCMKNPQDFAVLNTFDFDNAEQNREETVESIKYKTFVNSAGLKYKEKEVDDAFKELNGLVGG